MFPRFAVAVAVVSVVLMVTPSVWTLRYTVHNTKVIYFEALLQCIKNGGHLASIETPYQQNQIWNAIRGAGPSTESWWTSGTDLGMEGSWMWLSSNRRMGVNKGYTNFADTEPNNGNGIEHCLVMLGGNRNGQWSDVSCDSLRFYVCQYAY